MRHSIRWRILIPFVVLILASIWGLGLYLSHSATSRYTESLRSQLTDQAWLVAGAAERLTDTDPAGTDALAKELGGRIDARITLIDEDGTVLGDSQSDPETMENHADRPEVAQALAGSAGTNTRHSSTLGYTMMYVAVPVEEDGSVTGVARVALPLTQVNAYAAYVNYITAIAGVIASAAAVVIALLIARKTTDPVRKLTEMSSRVAEGDLDHRILIDSRDEIGELASAFNQMSLKLKQLVGLISGERDKVAAILTNMADGVVIVDDQERVVMVNSAAERILGGKQDDMLGRTFVEAARDHELVEVLRRCIQTGEQQSGAVVTDPQRRFVRMVATPIDSDGVLGSLIILQDLTELRRLETVRRDFASNISHELRTPLASIKALAETLQEGASADPTVADDFLERINVEVDKLSQMVQELSELSRIESGEVSFELEPIDLADVIDRARQRLHVQADRAGLSIHVDVPQDLPRPLADEEAIERVLLNLIHNAIKFTPTGGKITVSARAGDNTVAVSVSDTGVGIPSDELPRIFERFYRADKARTGGGTGMGLAIAKHIVRAHHGDIRAESTAGRGARFTFALPAAQEQ